VTKYLLSAMYTNKQTSNILLALCQIYAEVLHHAHSLSAWISHFVRWPLGGATRLARLAVRVQLRQLCLCKVVQTCT
jgi:hypothetical protein